jgi:O-antigen/teichoic acid export membrane protein
MAIPAKHHIRVSDFKGRGLFWNSVAALLARVAYAAGQWGQLIIIARFTNPGVVGEYGLALAVTTPVFAFLSLDLRALAATDSRGHFAASEYVSLRLYTSICAAVVVFALAAVLSHLSKILIIIGLVAALKFCDAISDIFYGIMQKHENMRLVAISCIIKSVISLAAMGIMLALTKTLSFGLLAVTATWAFIILLYDIRWSARLLHSVMRLSFSPDRLRRLVRQAFPLGLETVLMSLQTNIPRYFLDRFHGSGSVGHFAVLSSFLIAGVIVNGAIQQALGPRLALYYNAGERSRFVHLLLLLSAASVFIGVSGAGIIQVFGRQMVVGIYGEQYAKYAHLLVYLMGAGIVSYLFASLSTGLTVMRQLSSQAMACGCGAIVCLLSSWMLIPPYGLAGAVAAVLAGGVATVLVSGVALIRGLARRGMGWSLWETRMGQSFRLE